MKTACCFVAQSNVTPSSYSVFAKSLNHHDEELVQMRREVTSVKRNADGDTTRLCGAWGSVSKHQARSDIDAEAGAYHVGESDVVIILDSTVTDGFYLRTRGDRASSNNLESLSLCASC